MNLSNVKRIIYEKKSALPSQRNIDLKTIKAEKWKKTTNRNSKLGWEIRLETQIRNLGQQAKMTKQKKNARTCRDWKEKATKIDKTTRENKLENGEKTED